MTAVTVLTPTYNRSLSLRRTLASVRLQAHPVEHIVVDGGSSDDTTALLARAEQRWGVRWSSGPDGGMYHALNKGLDRATGELVGWVNDDDWLLPWTVSTAVSTYRKQPGPSAIYGDVLSLGGLEETAAVASVYGRFDRRTLAAVGTLAQPTVFWPLAATRSAGPLAADRYDEIADCEYWLRLSASVPFVKVREVLAVVVNHPDTKRSVLAEKVRGEWASIRGTYTPAGTSRRQERLKYELAWRAELLRGTAGDGWRELRTSPLARLVPPRTLRGPWSVLRRHPLRPPVADLSAYVRRLDEVARELDP